VAYPQARQLALLHGTGHRPGIDAEHSRRVGDGDDGGSAGPELVEIHVSHLVVVPHNPGNGSAASRQLRRP
jgi:hypothetical protein